MSEENTMQESADLSEEERQLLSAFIDGELKQAKHRELQERLDSGDEPRLLAELERLKQVRQATRAWHRELSVDESGVAKRVDLWSGIESSIMAEHLRNKDSVWQRVVDSIIDMFGSPAMGPAFAGLLLVLYLGFSDSADPVQSSADGSRVASSGQVDESIRPVSLESSRRFAGLQEPSFVDFQRELERLRAASAARSEMRRRSPLVIPVVPVIENRRAHSGFRSQGADIDWIRAEQDFNLYQSKDRSDPPVIWVAREGRPVSRSLSDEIR